MRNRIWFWAVGLLGLLMIAPTTAAAQTTPDRTIHACYIPLVGVVYRIKEAGLPPSCLSKTHIEFSWNTQGIKGDPGDTGLPGNLGLANQLCPIGYFVAGFNSLGTPVCRNSNGEAVQPPPPTNTLAGQWTFSPTITMRCIAVGIDVSLSLSGMTTEVTSSGRLIANLFGSVPGLPGIFQTFGSIDLGSTPVPATFPLAASGNDRSVLTGSVTGTVDYSFNGTFSTASLAHASLSVSAAELKFTPPANPSIHYDLNCGSVTAEFTAVK